MHEYDITLKRIMTRLPGRVVEEMTGFAVERWLNGELQVVRDCRVDMLGETSAGELVHIELQSTNQSHMARRMMEYAVDINRQFGRFPAQIVLYVGNAPTRMKSRMVEPWGTFEYRLVDVRELDAEPLLASDRVEENVIAVLMRLGNKIEAVRRILARIEAAEPVERGAALEELTILGGLRKLGAVLKREIKQMPILDSMMDHDLFGPLLRQGRAEGERLVVLRQIGRRFGQVPEWAKQRIDSLSASDLEEVELRLLEAGSLEELLPG